MNKLLKSLLLMPLLALSVNAAAAQYTEGEQYTKVNETVTKKKEVREYFSVYCGHCFKFEPIMHSLKKSLPEDASFERNHVDFLRAASPKIQQMITKATVVAEQLGDSDKLIGAVFNYIHVQRAVITTEKDLRNIFVLNGADGDKFDKLMKSFSVNSQAKTMKKYQENMTAKRVLTGVPTIIVNGKYKIDPAKLDRNNFEQDYQNLVKYLLELDS
ncbi:MULTISPECIES: thiol:disulfide interchange protein DsbA/DsbL [Colwellia]|uniref:Thiol:disulfide interchange protein n=1 Tax=Colwellia psychrerythraea (strain 34H / ATCC BAA-681) TaxID=167879 RepID=Q47W25_COLP3|nr:MULTISPECIES: thiol:disulfide interchange protein DsbA/DsbL [Colwellia]AAZ24519.1 thiol:disulfide interchange protein DsbA [Colwellia psychrerythraea 34H]PKH85519.1 thiol:disulfide interchange protein DsbA/DsbL [Colwellia sp. Bg11-28]